MHMIYCSKCGSEIPEYGNFCPECGTLVDDKFRTSDYRDENTVRDEYNLKKVNVLKLDDCAACVERYNLSPAEFMTLIYKPKHLDQYFKPPYRITLFYFILKDILELEIKSSRVVIFNHDQVSVKRGTSFEKFLSAPFKPYESIVLDGFTSRNSFLVDTYEKGPLSYEFQSSSFKNLFLEELLNNGLFKFHKKSIISLGNSIDFGVKEYILTDHGTKVREAIFSELGYDLEDRVNELDNLHDYLYILSFFGLDEGLMEDKLTEIQILDHKLTAIIRVYEGKRAGYRI